MASLTLTETEAKAAVRRGAELLDEKVPNWHATIFNWKDFNIDQVTLCIIGQLLANGKINATSYYKVLGEWGISTLDNGDAKYGFARPDHNTRDDGKPINVDYARALYKKLWKEQVERRLNAVTFPPKGHTVTLNQTERQLLIDMLEVREHELTEELGKLKPQYREFLNPAIMTTRALRLAVQGA